MYGTGPGPVQSRGIDRENVDRGVETRKGEEVDDASTSVIAETEGVDEEAMSADEARERHKDKWSCLTYYSAPVDGREPAVAVLTDP